MASRNLKKLTPTQSKILQFIHGKIDELGAPPTLHEIAKHFNYKSINSVVDHLNLIETKGYIRVTRGRARGIQILQSEEIEDRMDYFGIPILGRIAAGNPMSVFNETNIYLPVVSENFGSGDFFALEVHGDSMINAGIFDRDYAIIRKQPEVESGEIAAIVIDEEATLKRVIQQPESVILRAENSAFPELRFSPSNCSNITIAGLMTGLVRGIKPVERSN